jgi:hypothetical protein
MQFSNVRRPPKKLQGGDDGKGDDGATANDEDTLLCTIRSPELETACVCAAAGPFASEEAAFANFLFIAPVRL